MGYEGLSSEILGHIVSSFSNEEDDVADEDQEKESVDCLVASIADAMERKTNLSLLHGFLSDITTMIPPNGPLPSDLVLKEFNDEPRVDVVAKAHFLLKRHNQLPDSEVAGHLHKVRKKLDEEMFEILANEARLACDLANRKESDRPSREKLRHLFSFIRGEFEKNKEFALQLLGASILADLCENDYLLFDSYLSFLLERHHKLSSGVLNRTLVRVKNGVVSLRQAAAEKVSSEGAQALDIEEVRSRIKGLMNRKG